MVDDELIDLRGRELPRGDVMDGDDGGGNV